MRGRAEEALESLNEAIRLSPRDLHIADYYMCMGVAFWELERYPEALQWLERSRAQNPGIEGMSFLLASTYLRMGKQEKANAVVSDVLQTKPTGLPSSWNHLIRCGQPVRSPCR
jgi:tetratricopeptide (TPR) repeat protein